MNEELDPYFNYKPRDYDIFIGLDVDKKSVSLTAISHEGFLRSQKIPYGETHLLKFVARFFEGKRIVFGYEAGPTGYGLHDQLKNKGFLCLVIAPSMIPHAAGEKVKTNRLDSRKIAEVLRYDQVKGIHVPYGCYRDLRRLASLRQRYVQDLASSKVRCKALLLLEGLSFPASTPQSQWTQSSIQTLRKMPCAPTVRFKLDQILSTLEYSAKQVLVVTREMRRICRQEAELSQSIQLLVAARKAIVAVARKLTARIFVVLKQQRPYKIIQREMIA